MLRRILNALMGPADAQAPRHRGRRALVLAAAIGVPAFAAPGDWDIAHDSGDSMSLAAEPKLQPFEQPGMSFPGAAFYYLEETPETSLALPALDPMEQPVENAGIGLAIDAGPAARSFLSAGTGLDKARALRCMTQAIYYEAASESDAGQQAVAQVVLNRVAHSAWPNSVCGVVFQGSQRQTGCQFTFTCDGSLARQPSRRGWDRAQAIAARALAGKVYKPIGLATHYHTNWVNPYWAKTLDYVGAIGAHRFYRWRGTAGTSGAFLARYSGIESVTPVALRDAGPVVTAAEYAPASNGSAGEMSHRAEPAPLPAAAPVPAQQQSGPYAGAGQVKEQYSRVGQWKSQPGSPVAK